jgi:hypothetical protein
MGAVLHAYRVGLAGVVLAASCATSPRAATAPPTLLLHIEKRPDPSTPLMVWAVPPRGERLRLGMLTSATTNVVRFDRVDPALQYRFVAERPGGGASITSRPFTPGRVGVIAWDLTANAITPVDTLHP